MSRTLFLMKMLEDEKEWDNQIERDQIEKKYNSGHRLK